jgi:hypothetical protein
MKVGRLRPDLDRWRRVRFVTHGTGKLASSDASGRHVANPGVTRSRRSRSRTAHPGAVAYRFRVGEMSGGSSPHDRRLDCRQHPTKQKAQKQLAALYANETNALAGGERIWIAAQPDGSCAFAPASKCGLQKTADDTARPFRRLRPWARSTVDGGLYRAVQPGALEDDQRGAGRPVLFQHGDPDRRKPLAPWKGSRRTQRVAYVRCAAWTPLKPRVVPRAGLYGASMGSRRSANPGGEARRPRTQPGRAAGTNDHRYQAECPAPFPRLPRQPASPATEVPTEAIERDPARARDLLELAPTRRRRDPTHLSPKG